MKRSNLFTKDILTDQENEAIEFIRKCYSEHYEAGTPAFVGFSGGKDSMVLADLVKRSGVPYELHYSFTGIDPPELVQFIKKQYPEAIWHKPEMTFWQGMIKKNPPLRNARWCCDVLKKEPTKDHPAKFRFMGVRAEESSKRAVRGRIAYFNNTKITNFHPIFWWSSADIWEYIHKYKLPYCKLYDEGFARLGCIVCPFLTPKKMKSHRDKWPKVYECLDRHLKMSYEKVKLQHGDKYKFTLEEYMQWPNWKPKEVHAKKGLLK